MCNDEMCLWRLSPTRGRGNAGMDIYILKLTSGLYLKSGADIMTVPLDTFWNGMRRLVKSGAAPLISSWQRGNVGGLRLTWPHLQNCTQLVLDSDSMIRLSSLTEYYQEREVTPNGRDMYLVPDGAPGESDLAKRLTAILREGEFPTCLECL